MVHSNRRWVRGPAWIGTLLLGLVMVLSVAAPATANHIPNTSIVFYKPTSTATGKAQFGTHANGVLTLKGSLSTGKWTHVAVGRETLLFYNSANGKGWRCEGRVLRPELTRRHGGCAVSASK